MADDAVLAVGRFRRNRWWCWWWWWWWHWRWQALWQSCVRRWVVVRDHHSTEKIEHALPRSSMPSSPRVRRPVLCLAAASWWDGEIVYGKSMLGSLYNLLAEDPPASASAAPAPSLLAETLVRSSALQRACFPPVQPGSHSVNTHRVDTLHTPVSLTSIYPSHTHWPTGLLHHQPSYSMAIP
ncbi:hypothetical protein EDC01DRAFT_521988 [Geopyxis carbonaria]|nr:hypothetical protein EDC01DRAFT_521988 [Geopyxis carbonaria]